MSRNILITGGTGYIGGSLFAELKNTSDIPAHGTIYALVRNDEQAEKVRQHYDAIPLILDLEDQAAITTTLLEKQISVVFFMINAFNANAQLKFIQALEAVKHRHQLETHFLHTTGAKLFSNFVGHPTDRVLVMRKRASSRYRNPQTQSSLPWRRYGPGIGAPYC